MKNNNQKKEEIKKLLDASVFVSEEVRQLIVSKMDGLSETQLKAIFVALSKSMSKQSEMIGNLAKENPDFLFELNKTIDEAKKNLINKEEGEEDEKRDSAVKNLEEELNK